jgi:hypothetical protein
MRHRCNGDATKVQSQRSKISIVSRLLTISILHSKPGAVSADECCRLARGTALASNSCCCGLSG